MSITATTSTSATQEDELSYNPCLTHSPGVLELIGKDERPHSQGTGHITCGCEQDLQSSPTSANGLLTFEESEHSYLRQQLGYPSRSAVEAAASSFDHQQTPLKASQPPTTTTTATHSASGSLPSHKLPSRTQTVKTTPLKRDKSSTRRRPRPIQVHRTHNSQISNLSPSEPGPLSRGPNAYARTPIRAYPTTYQSLNDMGVRNTREVSLLSYAHAKYILCDGEKQREVRLTARIRTNKTKKEKKKDASGGRRSRLKKKRDFIRQVKDWFFGK